MFGCALKVNNIRGTFSGSCLDEMSVKSPRKTFYYYYLKKLFSGLKYPLKCLFCFEKGSTGHLDQCLGFNNITAVHFAGRDETNREAADRRATSVPAAKGYAEADSALQTVRWCRPHRHSPSSPWLR